MRIRTVKPEFWQDEDLAEISETARLVAIGLLNMADDEGFFNANEKLVSSLLFPLTEPSVSIHECLNQLVRSGYLKLHPCKKGKKVYGQVVNFLKHQKVNRPSPSKIKDLIQFNDGSLNDHGGITVGKEQGTGNREQGTGIMEMEGDSQKRHEPASPAKADQKSEELNFDQFRMMDMTEGQINELKKIRRDNKGGKITQRVINALAKEFNLSIDRGLSIEDILDEWASRGWKSYKDEWIKGNSYQRAGRNSESESNDWVDILIEGDII